MVSNARDDLPDPLSPVMTVRVLRGISTLMFFRLCCRAPLTVMLVSPIRQLPPISNQRTPRLSPVLCDRGGKSGPDTRPTVQNRLPLLLWVQKREGAALLTY